MASALLFLALGTAAGAASGSATYKIAPVAFDLNAGEPVGARRSGSLCLPAGAIAWREVKPDAGDAREAVTQGARRAGLSVGGADNPFEEGMTGFDHAIRVRVRGLRLTACVPPGGLGRLMNHSHAVKGDGVIAIEWRVYVRGMDDPTVTSRTCTAFTYRADPGALTGLTLAALQSAAAKFAVGLKAEGGGPTVIEDEACGRLRKKEGPSPGQQD